MTYHTIHEDELTIYGVPQHKTSYHGRNCTWLEWCKKEKRRIKKQGRDIYIKKNQVGDICLAERGGEPLEPECDTTAS